ncbi:hypothetical protein MJO28_004824 [Puccinia striiformis f. sp. tritici]|uniref:Uncharacterized protein n=1 Tax=Puccinia striiformis f. sp. tritici TaxID=168172 RepID=A0ACC0EJP9_9BASI|nr:hypothetical protein MJO28_004824 [Puccinia striiformis f. sp. tritici]
MAKLTDLPAELVDIIVGIIIDTAPRRDPYWIYKSSYLTVPGVTWPEGLPSHPLIPLSLVSSTFRECAQGRLFKRVELSSPWQAYLFLSALNSHTTHEEKNQINRISRTDSAHQSNLAQKVRSLNFKLSSRSTSIAGSMGKGGGSAICGILRSCPLLQSITINTVFLSSCKEPMMEALSTQRCIQEFYIPNHRETGPTEIQWLLEEMNARLFSKWDMLNTVELSQLPGWSFTMAEDIHKSIPVFNRALRTIALNDPDLDERELYSLLVSSRETIRTLKIIDPSSRLDRMGLFRILKDCTSPELESLDISVDDTWHHLPDLTSSEGLDDPARNPYMMDILFHSSFRKLKTLDIGDHIASPRLLSLLPDSIVDVEWCLERASDVEFVREVFAWRNDEGNESPPPVAPAGFGGRRPWLPNLCRFVLVDEWAEYYDLV